MSARIAILDYGMGNLGSIANMLKRIGAEAIISSSVAEIERADKLILPGVGSFDNGMKNLRALGLVSALNQKVLDKQTPVLGICLGMQLMTKQSEEGNEAGLGWIDAYTVKFQLNGQTTMRIPHMGWNQLRRVRPSSLLEGVPEDAYFYFAHTYAALDAGEAGVALCDHSAPFVAVLEQQNIFATQFHPEKSGPAGAQVLANFVRRAGGKQ